MKPWRVGEKVWNTLSPGVGVVYKALHNNGIAMTVSVKFENGEVWDYFPRFLRRHRPTRRTQGGKK